MTNLAKMSDTEYRAYAAEQQLRASLGATDALAKPPRQREDMSNLRTALIAASSSVDANLRAISGISWPTTRDKIFEHALELEAWLDARDASGE